MDECDNSKINMSLQSVLSLLPKDLFNSEYDALIKRMEKGLTGLEPLPNWPNTYQKSSKFLLPVEGERLPAMYPK
jgi:hypothetical protein